MKRILFLTLLTIIFSASCNKDDDSGSLSLMEQKLVATWKTNKEATGSCINQYILNSNKSILYKNYYNCNLEEYHGTWNVTNNILTRTFPEDEKEFVMKDSIISVNDNELVLKDLDNNRVYTYYK